jgi:pterin-4a-carbinolamine dehydratase
MSQMDRSESTTLTPGIGTGPAQAKPKTKLKAERIQAMLKATPGWGLSPDQRSITRSYRFPGLAAAFAFAELATRIAAASGDHPVQVVQLGSTVTCKLTSSWVNGLTMLDFTLAQRINLQE